MKVLKSQIVLVSGHESAQVTDTPIVVSRPAYEWQRKKQPDSMPSIFFRITILGVHKTIDKELQIGESIIFEHGDTTWDIKYLTNSDPHAELLITQF